MRKSRGKYLCPPQIFGFFAFLFQGFKVRNKFGKILSPLPCLTASDQNCAVMEILSARCHHTSSRYNPRFRQRYRQPEVKVSTTATHLAASENSSTQDFPAMCQPKIVSPNAPQS